ncbi:porin [Methylophilaceae bacterium]|nr:porin [Methylophilaceae bacterium]
MNNKIKAAVAGAVLASASVANAGITWDAGEWTVDMNGNVNAFAIFSDSKDTTGAEGGLAAPQGANEDSDSASISTGLLPAWLGFTATTRQNDIDTSVTISFQPGMGGNAALQGGGNTENRQAFLTFGDKSWGSVKMGKDLGIFGSTAILNDMTLLGVGATGGTVGNGTGAGQANGGTTTTLGGIGTGYLYADWKGQFAYTTPNMNGFVATVGITQPWNATSTNDGGGAAAVNSSATSAGTTDQPAFEAQASYSWTGDFAGKAWVGAFFQDVTGLSTGVANVTTDTDAQSYEAGIAATVMNIGLTGYYYSGEGVGTTGMLLNGFDATGSSRDSDGGYVQATYVIPMGTKLGVSYGISKLDDNASDQALGTNLVKENNRFTIGAYHPLTKHLNLVAEFSAVESESHLATQADAKQDIFSVGAILFF